MTEKQLIIALCIACFILLMAAAYMCRLAWRQHKQMQRAKRRQEQKYPADMPLL